MTLPCVNEIESEPFKLPYRHKLTESHGSVFLWYLFDPLLFHSSDSIFKYYPPLRGVQKQKIRFLR